MKRAAFGALLIGLVGCAAVGPLPVSTLQILGGGFPQKLVGPGGLARSYTIENDVFSFPAIGVSIKRPNTAEWAFEAGTNLVAVYLRDLPAGAVEPRPTLLMQLVGLPEGTDIAASKATDKAKLEKDGATVTVGGIRYVDGLTGDAWSIAAKDPKTGASITTLRIYVVQVDLQILTIIQVQGVDEELAKTLPAFESMLQSIKLPKGSDPKQGTTPASPAASPVAAGAT